MKMKVTNKLLKNNYFKMYIAGYCDLQYIMQGCEPRFYNTGVYGWNFDVFESPDGRAQFYVDCYFNYEDICNKNYCLLDEWIKTGVNKVKRELETLINDIYDSIYDDDYNYSYFEDAVYNCERFDDMTTDGRNVFFEVCRG